MTGLTRTFTLAETFGFCPADDVSDRLGSVRAVIDGDTGTVIEASDYHPFGKRIPLPVTEPVEVTAPVEATAPTSPNRWHFSGKESQSFLSASIPLLDFGARMYDPITARWTAQDPLAEEYYAVSPFVYCLNNAVNSIDCDGKAVWFLPIVKGAIGAAVDVGAQITVSMSSGKSFTESLKLVDLTSVGTAFVTSAILSPGASKGVKAVAAGINVLDAGVDYSINEGAKTIFNKKDIEQAVVELSIDRISGTAAKRIQKAFVDDANAKLVPSFMAPLSKDGKAILRSNKEYVEGESFPIIIDNISSFTSGMVENGIVVFVIAPNNTENEE